MKKRVLALVEGQTEERFVKDILAPHFGASGISFSATILTTKRVKDGPNFKGGVTNFQKFSNDLTRLLKSDPSALVTTIVDYYALPGDFPGMPTRPPGPSVLRVTHVENSLRNHFVGYNNFEPFLALHEYEAWLFSDVKILPRVMGDAGKELDLAGIRGAVPTPEDINDGPATAPSKRILAAFPAYKKTIHGPIVFKSIGIDRVRQECAHFDAWLTKLELACGVAPRGAPT